MRQPKRGSIARFRGLIGKVLLIGNQARGRLHVGYEFAMLGSREEEVMLAIATECAVSYARRSTQYRRISWTCIGRKFPRGLFLTDIEETEEDLNGLPILEDVRHSPSKTSDRLAPRWQIFIDPLGSSGVIQLCPREFCWSSVDPHIETPMSSVAEPRKTCGYRHVADGGMK